MEAPFDAPLEEMLAEREAVSGLARRLSGRDAHAAEDLEQEVWAAALRNPPREATSLRGWLRAVTRTRAVERLRRRGRSGRAEREAARPEAIESADEAVVRRDQSARLARALHELEEPYRTVLVLRFVEELAPRDVARRLGRPVETVRTQTRRGLILLRRKLEARDRTRPAWPLFLFWPRRPSPRAAAGLGLLGAALALLVLALAVARRGAGGAAAALAADADAQVAQRAAEPLARREPAPAAARPGAPALRERERWVDVLLRDGSGAALPGASVAVVGHGGLRPAGRTDARGALRVPLDLADLASAHAAWALDRDAVELAFEAPGLAARHAFVFLPEAGGARVSAALSQPGRALAGRVLDEAGNPLPDAEVSVAPAQGLGARERLDGDGGALAVVRARAARCGADGRFEIDGLPQGALRLSARAEGHALGALDVAPGSDGVELALVPAPALRGALSLAGQPAAGARVEWRVEGADWPSAWCRSEADGQGRFELARPLWGTLQLEARLDGARASGALALEPGPATWSAALAPLPALAVRVLEADGRPAARAWLVLRAAAGGALLAAGECDAQGRAQLPTEAAGALDLVVLPPRGEGTWPREVLRGLPAAGGSELALRLTPAPGPPGTLTAEFVPGAPARLLLRHVEGDVEHAAEPDALGRLEWGALPAGRWSARALLGSGREVALDEFELAPGETRDLGRIE